jgi:ABC-type lipoprotein release transport system permease subunit
MILKIAWRNLWRHRGRTLAIGSLLCFTGLAMGVGNGIISGMERGLTANITQLFTGDILVLTKESQPGNILFRAGGKPLKVIERFPQVKQVLQREPALHSYLPATAGILLVLTSGSEMAQLTVLGVAWQEYRQMFPDSFRVIQGRWPASGERGILLSEASRRSIDNLLNIRVFPEGERPIQKKKRQILKVQGEIKSNELILMGVNTANSMVDIRVPVHGIIRYKALDKIWGQYSLLDLESFREAYDYATSAETRNKIPEETERLLANDHPDQFFTSANLVNYTPLPQPTLTTRGSSNRIKPVIIDNRHADEAYNLIFIKLKTGISLFDTIGRLNRAFRKYRLNVTAVSWKTAVGSVGNMAALYRGLLNLLGGLLFFVAVIVIINVLSLTVLERVTELATMRAVGTPKSYLQKMLVTEIGIVFGFFGGIGIGLGMIAIGLLNMANLTTANEFWQMVYGGAKLSPVLTFRDLQVQLVTLGMMGCLAVLYPLKVVTKVTPLHAIAKE